MAALASPTRPPEPKMMTSSEEAAEQTGLLHFIRAKRELIDGGKAGVRIVYRSEIVRDGPQHQLDEYISDRAPLFYRPLEAIIADLTAGLFMTAMKSTLSKLPSSESFQNSHFGEIVAGLFAEEVLGLRRIYSKLAQLTTENANANNMDLLMYDPSSSPMRFVFGEVKCSPKAAVNGLPANHHNSCFADMFRSMKSYSRSAQNFDLVAARDNLGKIPEGDRERVRSALTPYSGSTVHYAGFALIDTSTYSIDEAQVLRTRKSEREFEVDLVCLESFSHVARLVYKSLQEPLKS